jgi:hypothetical protein
LVLPPLSPLLPAGLLDDALGLPLDEALLELLDWELLEELEELLELLEVELLGLLGADGVEGGDGVCGVVGLLALGQPLSSRQAQTSPPSLRTRPRLVLLDLVSPDNVLGSHWLARFKAGPESRSAQYAHQAIGPACADLVFIGALKVDHAAFFIHREF